MKKTDVQKLVSLGKIQTNRLTKDIIWDSLFISDYENRYGIDPHVVNEFADGYLDWISKEIDDGVKNDFSAFWDFFDKVVRNNKSGLSFYDYTHYMVCSN